jgi:multidrug efflux pump subunit AcrB
MTRALLIFILAALVLVVGLIGLLLWKPSSDEPLVVTVEAASPGSTAPEVEQTLAAAIEPQLSGVEHLRRLRSRSWRDGSYRLEVSFTPGIDVEIAQVVVQNRLSLALPILPLETQHVGVIVRKGSFGPLMILCVVSPDGRFDALQLSVYTNIKLKDELGRLPGVAEVTVLGAQEYVLRVWLDASKLQAVELTAADVAHALIDHKFDLNGGLPAVPGGVLTVTSAAQGGLITAEQIDAIVVKSDGEGHKVRLRDVCRVELEVRQLGSASLDGKDAVALAVYPLARAQSFDVRAALQAKLEDLRRQLPDGVELFAGFDVSQEAIADGLDYLLLDVDPAVEGSLEQIRRILVRCDGLLRQLAGAQNVLALSQQPFDRDRDQPCVVVALGQSKGAPVDHRQIMREIRAKFLAETKAASIGIRDLSSAIPTRHFANAVAFAITAPDRTRLQELAGQLVARMSQDRRLIDARSSLRLKPELAVDIDRAKLTSLGLDPATILDSLELVLGPAQSGETSRPGTPWRSELPSDAAKRANVEKFNLLRVRTRQGQMVPLTTVAAIRQVNEPTSLERIDVQPAISITANPADGSTLAEARSICEHLAAETLPKEQPPRYRLVWTGRQ